MVPLEPGNMKNYEPEVRKVNPQLCLGLKFPPESSQFLMLPSSWGTIRSLYQSIDHIKLNKSINSELAWHSVWKFHICTYTH